MVLSVNIPTVRGSQEEASQMFVEHSPWGGSGKREVRVAQDVVGLRTGFKSSIEIKCWTKKLDRNPDERPDPTCGEGEGQKQEQALTSGPWPRG